MSKLLTRARALGDIAVQLHAIITLAGIVLAVFGVAVAVMSYVLSSIAELSKYGWGLPVLIAIGIVLAIVVVLSLAAVPAAAAYRRWRPHEPPPPPLPIFATKEAPAAPANDLEDKISDLKQSVGTTTDDLARHVVRLDSRDDDLAENTKSVLGLVEKLNERMAEFRDRLVEIGADNIRNVDQINKELLSLQSDRAWVKRTLINLLDALHARDKTASFKGNDHIVWCLGLKLLKTNPPKYGDVDEWLKDYRRWSEALSSIDAAASYLGYPGNRGRPFLDIEPAELEACLVDPPDVIGDSTTLIPYRKVHLAFQQYERYREPLTKFIDQRTALAASSNIP